MKKFGAVNFKYDVSVSYAREQIDYVRNFVASLRNEKVDVFFDLNEQERLFGNLLPKEFLDVFTKESKHCVVFVSKEYVEKDYTIYESECILSENVFRKNYLYVIRFDKVELPGLSRGVAFLDANTYSPYESAKIIYGKIKSLGSVYRKPKEEMKHCFSLLTDFLCENFKSICGLYGNRMEHYREPEKTPTKHIFRIYRGSNLFMFCQIWFVPYHSMWGSILLSLYTDEPDDKESSYNAIIKVIPESAVSYSYIFENNGFFTVINEELQYMNYQSLLDDVRKEMLKYWGVK